MRISYATLILYDKIIPFSKRSVNAETAVYGSISKNGSILTHSCLSVFPSLHQKIDPKLWQFPQEHTYQPPAFGVLRLPGQKPSLIPAPVCLTVTSGSVSSISYNLAQLIYRSPFSLCLQYSSTSSRVGQKNGWASASPI